MYAIYAIYAVLGTSSLDTTAAYRILRNARLLHAVVLRGGCRCACSC